MSATNSPAFAAPNYEVPKKGRSKLPIVIVSLLIIGALAVTAFLYVDKNVGTDNGQIFSIPSEAMVPTLDVNDRVLTTEIGKDEVVERGWIVIMERPPAEVDSTLTHLIKRVVGLPGDTVEAKGGVLYVNDKPISEPYLAPGSLTLNLTRTTLPPNSYWVLGDNRENSADSRYFGPVDRALIKYKAEKIIYPNTRRKDL